MAKKLLPKTLMLEPHKTFKLHVATDSKRIADAQAETARRAGHRARVKKFSSRYAVRYGVYIW